MQRRLVRPSESLVPLPFWSARAYAVRECNAWCSAKFAGGGQRKRAAGLVDQFEGADIARRFFWHRDPVCPPQCAISLIETKRARGIETLSIGGECGRVASVRVQVRLRTSHLGHGGRRTRRWRGPLIDTRDRCGCGHQLRVAV